MGRMKSCTPEMRAIIVRKYCNDKMSMAAIAKDLAVSKSMVYNAIRVYTSTGSIQNPPRSNPPRKTTQQDDRAMARISKKMPFSTASDVLRELEPDLQQSISVRTVRRRLNEFGLRGCIARRKPLVSTTNLMKRLKFAKLHRDKSVSFWKRILWSDESKFNMFGSDGKVYVRRPINKSLDPRYTIKTLKHGGGNIMVWGAFSWSGVGPLVRINGRMDQYQYRDIMADVMIPYVDENMTMTCIFQHDNDPKHTSRTVKACLSEFSVAVLEWPPQSPDLNPIENLWSIVERKMKNNHSRTPDMLFEKVKEIWQSIPVDVCQKLVESMPRRCSDVITNKGYPTKY